MDRVDLHGMKHQDVKQILDNRIWQSIKNQNNRLYIITGHSTIMKKIVTNIAREYNLTAVTNMFNFGEMIIDF